MLDGVRVAREAQLNDRRKSSGGRRRNSHNVKAPPTGMRYWQTFECHSRTVSSRVRTTRSRLTPTTLAAQHSDNAIGATTSGNLTHTSPPGRCSTRAWNNSIMRCACP